MIGPATFDKLCRARALLLREGASVARVASAVGLSRAHFIRQFEALFGATPHRFRTRERLERARLLLAAGSSVTDACMEVGFASLGSFSGLFARWSGAPPSRYVAPPEVSCLEPMTLSEKHASPGAE